MLSVALARAAAEAGHKVLFTTCDDMTRRLRRAIAEHRFPSGLRFFTSPRLLVIDEVGYRILDEESRSLLFEVINARYLKGSVITTSHVGIASWAERLGDPMLAAAALDRLLHRGVIVGIDGPSYRMRAHQQRADVIRKAADRGRDEPVTAEQRDCPACGTEFTWTPAAPRQKYCSTRCKHRWHRAHGKPRPPPSRRPDPRRRASPARRDARAPAAARARQAASTAAPACPHCRQPVALVAWLVPPAAANVTTPPRRHANAVT